MTNFPDISSGSSAAEARDQCLKAGWSEIGVGDWSWAFGHADSPLALRVTPFDPAYRMFAEACLEGPASPWLPRVQAIVPLRREGYVTILERLWPAPADATRAFCVALGVANHSGYEIVGGPGSLDPADPDLEALRARILMLMECGSRRFALWGGSDIRPGNVMMDAHGQLKLIDPIFLRGLAIVEAIDNERADLLADFSQALLEDFLTIPPFKPGPESDALKAKVTRMFAGGGET